VGSSLGLEVIGAGRNARGIPILARGRWFLTCRGLTLEVLIRACARIEKDVQNNLGAAKTPLHEGGGLDSSTETCWSNGNSPLKLTKKDMCGNKRTALNKGRGGRKLGQGGGITNSLPGRLQLPLYL